jgi:predicted membrane-bound spermidine synthase
MMHVNWLAVVVAAVSAFVLGGLWYGPLFRHAWCREAGIAADGARHPARVFAVAFLAALLAAVAFAFLLGPAPGLHRALHHGFVAGLGIAAMSFGINYAFAGRSLKLWLIDGGYHTLQFTLYGLIIGLWQ